MSFHPNQRVVCVNDQWGAPYGFETLPPTRPKKGRIYTIAKVVPAKLPLFPLEYLVLHEMPRHEGALVAYDASHFQPIADRETDISIFKKLLEPKPLRVVELPDIGP